VVRRLPHVAVVSPAALQTAMTQSAIEIISGIDYESYNALRPFVFLDGGPFKQSDDVIVDDVFARSKNPATGRPYAVGDTLEVINTPFHICGIVEHGKGGRKLIPLSTMDQLIGTPNKASIFYIKADDTRNDQAIIDEIHNTRGLLNFPIQTMEEWLSTMTPEKMPGFNLALEVVQGIAIIVGFLVIFQTMYTAVLERTREIGILKSMGASKGAVVGVILRETAFLAVIGVIVGIACTYLVRIIMLNATSLQFQITGRWLAQGAAIAFVGSILGALYPSWMAARKDPIDALAYE
jgi:putative ABC transport system permease protein